VESMRQVAEYKGKLGTTDYGHMLISIATEYNNALLAIENANIGWAVIQVALDRGYSNLYYSYKQDGYVDETIHLRKNYDLKDKSQMVPGFTTSARTRPLMVSKIETYFREKSPIIHSRRTIEEMYVFIWNGQRAEAQRGYNDDLIMSMAIGLWVRDTALKLRQQGVDLTMRSLSHIGKTSNAVVKVGGFQNNTWEVKGTNGQNHDLRWLL